MGPVAQAIADFILARRGERGGAMVVGLCGAQGSGKSTAALEAAQIVEARGLTCTILSLDDLYLPRAARLDLARDVHPLLATRGPPGTHDVALGASLLADLRAGRPTVLPRFDKLADDRAPPSAWRPVSGAVDVVLFEGWCVGATPQPPAALMAPINALECDRDPDGRWRAYVNQALAQTYPALFGQINALIMLRAPSFEVVAGWRLEQEQTNRLENPQGRVMDEGQVRNFIQYFERLTRHMLDAPPASADLVINLDARRQIIG